MKPWGDGPRTLKIKGGTTETIEKKGEEKKKG